MYKINNRDYIPLDPAELEEETFIKIYHVIAKANTISWNEKAVLCYVLSWTTNGQECFASNRTIAEALGLHERTINRTISSLRESGYVKAWYQISSTNNQVVKRILYTQKTKVFEALTKSEAEYFWTEELPAKINKKYGTL